MGNVLIRLCFIRTDEDQDFRDREISHRKEDYILNVRSHYRTPNHTVHFHIATPRPNISQSELEQHVFNGGILLLAARIFRYRAKYAYGGYKSNLTAYSIMQYGRLIISRARRSYYITIWLSDAGYWKIAVIKHTIKRRICAFNAVAVRDRQVGLIIHSGGRFRSLDHPQDHLSVQNRLTMPFFKNTRTTDAVRKSN